jgi:hypothetical protein
MRAIMRMLTPQLQSPFSDDSSSRREVLRARNSRWRNVQPFRYLPMASTDVVPIPGEEARRALIADREHPKAVVFDFEQPIRVVEWLLGPLHDRSGK